MRDPLTFQAWPWALIALPVIAWFLYLADRYDRDRLPAARASLDRLDAVDPDGAREQDLMETEFVQDIEAWLRARDKYEEETA